MKIAYKKTDGKAYNLRFVSDDYAVEQGETVIDGDVLPDIKTLHDADYLDNQIKANKKAETEALAGEKISVILPKTRKALKLIRKEANGNASQAEKNKLNAMDALQDAEDLIKDQIDLDSNYDHINSPLWP